MRIRSLIALGLIAFVSAATGWCDETGADSTHLSDTLLFDGTGLLEHSQPVTSDVNFEKRLRQNPTVGLFKSMFVPGWGQLGNRRYTKAVIFAGLDAWFIGAAIHYGRQASDFKVRFDLATDLDDRRELYDLYLDRKDERNKFTWFAVIITFISMFDAYVDAHLSGYPHRIEENSLTLDIRPAEGGGFMARVALDF
ncbi:MAG: hypothetical protein JSU74_01210 [Candidatus Zixiibacteriota bacterium]|nr:MAG: hypothetical protein JSU74_01210 [candidate division Zixibacteria bacterium]